MQAITEPPEAIRSEISEDHAPESPFSEPWAARHNEEIWKVLGGRLRVKAEQGS